MQPFKGLPEPMSCPCLLLWDETWLSPMVKGAWLWWGDTRDVGPGRNRAALQRARGWSPSVAWLVLGGWSRSRAEVWVGQDGAWCSGALRLLISAAHNLQH